MSAGGLGAAAWPRASPRGRSSSAAVPAAPAGPPPHPLAPLWGDNRVAGPPCTGHRTIPCWALEHPTASAGMSPLSSAPHCRDTEVPTHVVLGHQVMWRWHQRARWPHGSPLPSHGASSAHCYPVPSYKYPGWAVRGYICRLVSRSEFTHRRTAFPGFGLPPGGDRPLHGATVATGTAWGSVLPWHSRAAQAPPWGTGCK